MKLLLIISTIFSSSLIVPLNAQNIIDKSVNAYAPCYVNSFIPTVSEEGIRFDISFTCKEDIKSSFSAGLAYIDKNEEVKIFKYFVFSVTKNVEKKLSYLLPISDIPDYINEYIFSVAPPSPISAYGENIKIKVTHPKYCQSQFTWTEKENGTYKNTNYYLSEYHRGEDLNYLNESFSLYNFEDLKLYEIYKYFHPDELMFAYRDFDIGIIKSKFNFLFYDAYGYFPSIPYYSEESMLRKLELEPIFISEDGNGYSYYKFKFKDQLYYHPDTWEFSLENKEGYTPTDKLYFPRFEADKLKNIKCRYLFEIDNYYPFQIAADFNLSYIKTETGGGGGGGGGGGSEEGGGGGSEDTAYIIGKDLDLNQCPNEKIKEIIL